MSKRFDITDGTFATTKKNGLIYTEELGWIDLGHAQGDDARFLKKKLEQEQWEKYYNEFNDWYFPVNYYQEMGKGKNLFGVNFTFHTGVHTQVMVRACLSPVLKARVALTIMYGTAKRFEAWQNSILFNWYTDSGFSVEDLVSDLVGFYRVFGTGPDPLWRAKPVSYETAIQIWDAHDPIGTFKNRDFFPYLFSTKPPFRYGEPIKKNLPEWLSYIKPLDNSFSGLLYNQFNNNPVGDFFKEKNRLNHELYGTFSISDTLGYADSPFDRPSFFLLHPHSPLK
ncbi:TPA: hypothetical protein OL683_001606 [Citrobacter freundii]|nr:MULTISPECIES: hypothetical protein [Citrobacter]KAA3570309.1 hypothetical protein D1173_08935 [Citrobacter freundii]MBA8047706.1 hypothetical protein [Citrobacter freundii]MDM3253480.1 hypothetical protein [Citrobacter sp. Cf077]HAT3774155.1 hypothetical protein [Citrobacter freundii]HCQ6953004.1 hypothetical protein [Citrobacter freundii]